MSTPTVATSPPVADADLIKAAVKYETAASNTSMIPRVSAAGLADDITALAAHAVETALKNAQTGHVPPTFWRKLTRQSDRLLTPMTISVLIITGGLVCLGTLALMVYVGRLGQDPQAVLDDATKIVTAITGMSTLGMMVMHRHQTSRIERNTAPTP